MLGLCPQTPNGFRWLGVAPIPKTTTLSLQIFGFAPGLWSVLGVQMRYIKIFRQSQVQKSRCMRVVVKIKF